MIKFGTGGWRAVIGEDFIKENVCKVAAGVLKLMQSKGKTDKPVIIFSSIKLRIFASNEGSESVSATNAPTISINITLTTFLISLLHAHVLYQIAPPRANDRIPP